MKLRLSVMRGKVKRRILAVELPDEYLDKLIEAYMANEPVCLDVWTKDEGWIFCRDLTFTKEEEEEY